MLAATASWLLSNPAPVATILEKLPGKGSHQQGLSDCRLTQALAKADRQSALANPFLFMAPFPRMIRDPMREQGFTRNKSFPETMCPLTVTVGGNQFILNLLSCK